jgi:chorismate synthase
MGHQKIAIMPGNSTGTLFKLTSFGESHGTAIGGIVEGFPPDFKLNFEEIQQELDKRKPGQSELSSSRKESDQVEFLSGLFNGKTLGTPIGFIILNKDQQSKSYNNLKDIFRPSHADFTYSAKYGIRDHRGGGRASARETAARVVAGAMARQFLAKQKIIIQAYVSQIGSVICQKNYTELDLPAVWKNDARCPDAKTASAMMKEMQAVKKQGDTLGGIISAVVKNVPAGLGEPVFSKLEAELGKAILSIPACRGFEVGSGFSSASMKGSEHNDIFCFSKKKIHTLTNRSGGIQGGISNGEDIVFRAAFKPVASVFMEQETVDSKGKSKKITLEGRHDPCVVPRAVIIVEAMTAMVLMDMFLQNRAVQLI